MNGYYNFKPFKNGFLITNDWGKYALLSSDNFKDLLLHKKMNDVLEKELYDKHFIYDGFSDMLSEKAMFELRNSKNHLFRSTQLFIFVVTTSCNQKCIYCQAQNDYCGQKYNMSLETAKKAVDIALQSPSVYLTFEFQGGEPLINFETIRYIVDYSKANMGTHKIDYTIVTNLTLLTDEMLNFIALNNISIATSIDGNSEVHNINRPLLNGNSFYVVKSKISKVAERGIPFGAIETTTKYSLPKYKEIVDEYVSMSLDTISLRPLTPLGMAKNVWEEIGYSEEEYLNFYRKAFEYIIDLNKKGTYLRENTATVFLSKIIGNYSMNHMEYRSPCGATIGQMAFYCDGNVFTCDEARMIYEMGDDSFRLGTIDDSFDKLVNSKVARIMSDAATLESLPSCSECVYNPFCGVCPIVNYCQFNDLVERSPNHYRCKINKGILDLLFEYLTMNNEKINEILRGWIS